MFVHSHILCVHAWLYSLCMRCDHPHLQTCTSLNTHTHFPKHTYLKTYIHIFLNIQTQNIHAHFPNIHTHVFFKIHIHIFLNIHTVSIHTLFPFPRNSAVAASTANGHQGASSRQSVRRRAWPVTGPTAAFWTLRLSEPPLGWGHRNNDLYF